MSAHLTLPERALTFALDGEMFAIDAGCVREILDVPTVTRVPGAPPFADGLINVRGAIVPLTDLAVAFGMTRGEHSHETRVIVIEAPVEGEATTIGILADKVHDVTAMDGVPVDEPPPVGMKWRADYIHGIARHKNNFVIIPNLQRIFAEGFGSTHKNGAALLPS